ncbi:MAG TPA: N(4)-(beta-N-acetylglucosaminyl)-L-asparaginase [Gemmatimonadaceae bacterium]|nr:N(4)-(beta-N-acetylglucosaminyl)-L-asparaginase [Gemmatimonadaceae bacterium]
MSTTRRDFLTTGAAAAAGLVLPPRAGPSFTRILENTEQRPPATLAGRPVVVASDNALRGVKIAYDMLAKGADPLDAAIAGANIQELDPEDQSVGLGGLPNADGVVQLDASVMHGPTKRAGSVASLEDIATPSLVAKAVMDYTDHVMLVGPGARRFALEMGFTPQNLLTEKSRQYYLRWKANLNADDNWLDHKDDVKIAKPTAPPRSSRRPSGFPSHERAPGSHLYFDERGVPYSYGTVNINTVTASGDIASCTSTSGLSWKIPGRIGDSPIIGAGQYCDNEVGAAGSTGRGEANIKVCGAFLAVEFMRQGMTPEAALMKVMERVIAMTEKRLLNERGRPYFDLEYYAVNKRGDVAGATCYEGGSYAVCDAQGARSVKMAYLYKRAERPTGKPISGTLVPP